MRPNITITIPEPYLPLAEYFRRTTMDKSTARLLMIKDGRMPIKYKSDEKGLVEINMAALTVQILADCKIVLTV
ncbi:regulator [Brenneria rubrifaciens]|uniref:Regulator n=1 Tax=Brenneria rubrifaciens TaxID=55213 RepID=A0A4P8QKU5_9GAMM|nr:regulator [Brenneria rubrifaciens]QCR07477.1 regulator [Brenneria rubrifaciens]